MNPTPQFEEFLAQNASDIEEAIVDLAERFHRLLERLSVRHTDPVVEELRQYMFDDVQ